MSKAVLMAAMLAASAATIGAQVKTIPEETITATATIEAIDHSTRTVTIKDEQGSTTRSMSRPGHEVRRSEGRRQDHGALLQQPDRPAEEAG
jgi:hypothetical protein